MSTIPNRIATIGICQLYHNICSGWKKYHIISILTVENITIFIPDGINSMEYLFFTEKNIKDCLLIKT
jgi:hypothetical protein